MVTKRPRPFQGEMATFEVTAAVLNVVRPGERPADSEAETYERGDTVELSRAYANGFCKAGLLRLVQDDDAPDPEPEAPAGDLNADGQIDQYEAMTKPELQEAARARGLTVSGTVPELVARLQEHDAAQSGE